MQISRNLYFSLFLTLFLTTGPLNAEPRNMEPHQKQKVRSDLDRLLVGAHDSVGFNGTALVALNGDLLLEKSVGSVSDRSEQLLTPEYAFSPGSITKEFSAIAIIKLIEEESLSLEQSIDRFFPSLPEWTKEITVEHLMTHTSGLPDVSYRKSKTTEQALEDLRTVAELKFKPGTDFYYGNNNTILRALIVERVTGKSFSEFVEERIFSPLRMRDTFAKDDFTHENRKIALGAMSLALNGVTAYTTAADLLRLETALWTGNFMHEHFVGNAITKPSLGGKGRAYYDFGFYKLDAKGALQSIEHDGTYPSHYALKHTNLQKGYTIVLLSNDGRKSTLTEIREVIVNYLDSGILKLPYTWLLKTNITDEGIAKTIEFIKVEIENGRFELSEDQLNLLGYDYFYDGDGETALELLKLNFELHEDSLNAIDSYVEVLLNVGSYKEADPLIVRGLGLAEQVGSDYFKGRFMDFKKIANEAVN